LAPVRPVWLAGVYAARKRLSTLLVAQNIGGQVNRTLGVENYLGYQFIEGADLIARFQEQVKQYPLEQQIGWNVLQVKRIDGGFEVESENGSKYESRAVVLATGKRSRELGVPGETEFAGRGVSYCSICDGPLFADQRVVVVGGGNSALEAALDMVKIADHVDLISVTDLTGDAVLIEKLKGAGNLNLYLGHTVDRIEGETLVQSVQIVNVQSGHRLTLPAGGVFVEIGLIPNSEPVAAILELNGKGEVPVNCSSETAVPGLFAAGDVSDVPEKQIIVAAGEGAKAVLQAHRYLQRLSVK
jgi:alkyl hydroperoxide reductase subunit F